MKIVIGGAYGDEGKGKMVDEYASTSKNPLVVRSHSSGQCSHTVVVGDKRHVFGHVGAGTFAGAPTYFGRKFYHNLLILIKEINKLKLLGVTPKLYSDPFADVILPHDILLNRSLEQSRDIKHGSCGVGYGVSVERSMIPDFGISIRDFNSHSVEYLMSVGNEWAEQYLEEHPYAKQAYYGSPNLAMFKKLIEIMKDVTAHIEIASFEDVKIGREVIFEGAQGLLLDERYGAMPHVTWGDCGVLSPLNTPGFDVKGVEINYVLRSYLTRHGNGPMLNEISPGNIVETTNTTNEFQGEFRFGVFDTRVLETINKDAGHAKFLNPKLVATITWMDAFDKIPFTEDGINVQYAWHTEFIDLLLERLDGFEQIHFRYEPAREAYASLIRHYSE